LRKWIETDRAGLRTHRRLTEAAQEWAEANPESKEGALYADARLAVAREWSASHRAEMSALEAAFLSASQEHERQLRADETEKNRRLAEAERQRAEGAVARQREAEAAAGHQKRLRQRFQIATVVALLLTLVAGLQTWRANRASETARTKEKLATSRQLAALSVSERNKHLDRSLLLAVEALRTENTSEARDSLIKALQDRPGLRSFLHTREGDVRSVAFSPDGKTLAAGYGGVGGGVGGAVLWDVAARKRLSDDPLAVKEGGVWSVAFSPDGKILAAGYGDVDGGAVLWDASARKPLSEDPLAVRGGDVQGVAFGPDGKTFAAGYVGGGATRWDVDLKSWQRLAGRIANRNFTRDEWRQYFPDEPYRPTFPDLPVPPEANSPNMRSSR